MTAAIRTAPEGGLPALAVRNFTAGGLQAFDFELAAGECVAVTGPSGSGKTRLLRAIADLDPGGGEAHVEGQARDSMPAPAWRRSAGYLAPEPGWWAETVAEHFPQAPEAPAAADAATALLSALGLPEEALGWPVARLSSGEAQRLALARLMVGNPPVLLLDEPTGALDAAAKRKAEAVLKERLDRGTAILIVTHDRAQARRLAGRALKIAKGRIREGKP